jgi:hypothetical protein
MATSIVTAKQPTLYEPLNSKLKDIRLLELHPGKEDQDITCSLHPYQLGASFNSPYEALSYVWGSDKDKVPIKIGQHQLEITVNLATALRRLRNPETSRLLWIDQICINQSDEDEKEFQIGLMKNIYESASRAVIWLGPDTGASYRAMHFIKQFEEVVNRCFEDGRYEVLQSVFEQRGIETPLEPDIQTPIQAVVEAIMMNNYVERYWIIQEIVLGRDAVVYYGTKSAPWKTIVRFMEAIQNFSPSVYDIAREISKRKGESGSVGFLWTRLSTLQKYRHQRGTAEHDMMFEPWYLVLLFRYSKATVPSDRIYAWLGLCDQWRKTDFKIDYKRAAHETFKTFSRAMIENDRTLDWLSHAGSPRTFTTLPSWVPDLELEIGKRPDPLMLTKGGLLYAADQGSEFSAEFIQSSSSLLCKGVCVDKVSFLTAIASDVYTICREGELDELCTPSELVRAVRSRYNDTLQSQLHSLYTADRVVPILNPGGVKRGRSRDSYASMLRSTLWVGPQFRPWLNSMNLLAESTLNRRAVFISEKGYVGLVPEYALEGDMVCVLFGSKVPVVLRKEGDGYRFIGDW